MASGFKKNRFRFIYFEGLELKFICDPTLM